MAIREIARGWLQTRKTSHRALPRVGRARRNAGNVPLETLSANQARYRMLALIAGLMLTTMPAHAQDLVVINSGAGHYKPGQTVPVGERIKLADGATLTLIASSGAILRLVGPYSDTPSFANTNKPVSSTGLASLKSLVTRAAKKSASLGATRDADEKGTSAPPGPRAKLWDIDAQRSGAQCIKGGAVKLVRHTADDDLRITIWPMSGTARNINWPAGETAHQLDQTDDIVSGTQLSIAGGKAGIAIILWRVPDEIDTNAPGRALLWLSEKGCTRQALQLAVAIAQPEATPK